MTASTWRKSGGRHLPSLPSVTRADSHMTRVARFAGLQKCGRNVVCTSAIGGPAGATRSVGKIGNKFLDSVNSVSNVQNGNAVTSRTSRCSHLYIGRVDLGRFHP